MGSMSQAAIRTSRAWIGMTALAALVSAYALVPLAVPGFGAPFLVDRFANFRVPTVAHILAGAVVLLAGALQFHARLRAQVPAVHRWIGRVYVIGVLVSGTGGLLMARISEAGPVTHWGFGLLAACWLATTVIAYLAIRRGDVTNHRRWMIRSYSLCFAAVTLRIILPLEIGAGLPFETAYRIVSWAAWVPNLIAVEWWMRRR